MNNSLRSTSLRSTLRIIASLVVLLPFCIFFYLFYVYGINFDRSQEFILIFLLILVLAGLIILRKIFDKFLDLSKFAQKVDSQVNNLMSINKNADELERVSCSFNNLLKRFEDKTNELQKRIFELLTIKELIEISVNIFDGDELLKVLLDKAVTVTGAEVGSVYMVEPEKQGLRLVDSKGFEENDKSFLFIEVNEPVKNDVNSEKRPLASEDFNKNLEYELKNRLYNKLKGELPSFLSMIIYGSENILGVLNLAYRGASKSFDLNDRQVLLILVTEISFALEDVILRSKIQMNLKELQEKTFELSIANEKFKREIAERKLTEDKLRETTSFLKNILDSSSSISIISTDLTGNIMFWNTGAEKIFGYTSEEVVGKQKISILYPDKKTELELRDIKTLIVKGEKVTNKEVKEITKDGQILWINLNLTPMFDENGQVKGILGIGGDITKPKQAELEKEEINKQLIKAQKMEMIGHFAGGLAHDANSILSVIHGYADILQKSIKPEDPRYQYTGNIMDAIERTSSLFKKLLTFSRNKPLQLSSVNINSLIKNMEHMIECLMGKDIKFFLSLDPEIYPVKVDQGQIEQVIMNLATNARDAMPYGGKLILKTENIYCDEACVRKIPEAQPGLFVSISVKDTGIGMSEEIIKHIFEPLFSTKKADQGTGLGLFVVYGIIKQHEGWIDTESKPGKGSTFRIYLPAFVEKIEEGRE